MRNIGRIFRDDIAYACSSIVTVLVTIGLCLVPVLYAWFNIAGSWDPYGNTDQLKVAVANSDEGFQSDFIPVHVNIGDRVIDMLRGNDEYGWTFVNEDDAIEGVNSGEYYAAVVIPGDFSQKMMSVLSSDAEQATIAYYVNLKENPIAPVLAGEGEAELLEDIRVEFTDAVDTMAVALASDFMSFLDSDRIDDYGTRLVSRLNAVADGLDDVSGQVRAFSRVVEASSALTASTAEALAGSDDATDASGGIVARLSDEIDAAAQAARTATTLIGQQVASAKTSAGIDGLSDEKAEQLARDIDDLVEAVSTVDDNSQKVVDSLKKTVDALADSTGSLASDLNGVRNSLGITANRLNASASKVRQFSDDISAALARGNVNEVTRLVGTNASTIAQWLSAPVEIEKHEVYPVENYGSSMAPFYTILSIWVGAVVLVALMKTNVSEERVGRYEEEGGRPVRNYELYLGRYLVFFVLCILQATIVCLGDLLFLRIQCVQPLLFLAACWACALVFSSIVYTFALSFGEIGKALCIVLLVMQVAGSGGEYPVQMMGDFFQAVYPFLPFTYGMHAMQASVAGVYGMEYLISLAGLSAFLLLALFLGLVIRRPVIRFANYFARKIEETGLM